MMLLRKDVILLTMKLVTGLFLLFMLTRVVKLFVIPDDLTDEEQKTTKTLIDNDIITFPIPLHIFAFLLGAVWNARKIVNIGIM